MALHFSAKEFAARMERLQAAMDERRLDCMLLFAQESMYWLTGYDSFGFCFFQCMIVRRDGEMVLLTRAPDLRQARHTSILTNIVIWIDRDGADPTVELKNLLGDLDLVGARIGIEYDTAGLNGLYGRLLDERLKAFGQLQDASDLVAMLRAVKSRAEIAHVRKAAELADEAFDAAVELTKAGADEGEILAAMHSVIFAKGGDYPGNSFIIGSGKDALLCRYKSGRRKLSKNDQLTLEWAGTWAHYHAAMMRTLIVGKPTARHLELYEAARNALTEVRDAMVVGKPISEMFDAHARVLDAAGLVRHRLNACGYSLGASFGPSWMDRPMVHAGNRTPVERNMVLFLHMIIADSETGTAMTLGQTYLATASGPESLSRHEIDLIVR
ncbi:MAG: Xaa-Pro dipeptidase [Alphaproteobacteria bacterium]|nr:MAG: Xaa-Pro dipeptidase [Alphaproteobacteria bacterium]